MGFIWLEGLLGFLELHFHQTLWLTIAVMLYCFQ